jgi:branched-chain amino acid transport system ATP-binding protein
MTVPLLEMRNIETYYGPIMAIRGVSLVVNEGEIVTVLGANGAGKTTLLKTASGALDASKGQVFLDGKEIQNRDPDWVARQGLAHVPEGREVFPFLNVAENLAMGAYNRSDKQAIAADVETVYGYFPVLRDLRGKMAAYLSGGQQQMLAIGRGYMAKPRLLLMDEPSLGLSPALVEEIFEIITRLNREQGLTILLVEQNANVALRVSQRGYVMEVGGMVMDPW